MNTKDMMKPEAQFRFCRWRSFSSFRREPGLCRTKVMDEEAKSCLLGVIVGDSGAAVQMTCMLQFFLTSKWPMSSDFPLLSREVLLGSRSLKR